MAEREELETLVYCLGPVGGPENNVITQGLGFSSKYDYTTKGYSRYIEEARNVIKFQNFVINYFMATVKSELEESPLAFIDAEPEDDLMASIRKMRKPWKEMFKEHQRELRAALKNPKEVQADEESSEESSSSSSAKIRRLDPEASSEDGSKTLKPDSEPTSEDGSETLKPDSEPSSEAGEETPKSDKEITPKAESVGVPVDEVEFPESIFHRRLREFHQSLKMEYRDLKARMGKALERFSSKEGKVQDIKGFTFLKMSTFAKWKYALRTLDRLTLELEKKFGELDLDFYKKKENEKRLTDWLFFDDGKRDRKYHHRLLITMELTGPIEEVSGVVCKQLRRWGCLTQSLLDKLPTDHDAFQEKVEEFKYEVLYHRKMKKAAGPQKSNDSGDTMFNIDDMPEET